MLTFLTSLYIVSFSCLIALAIITSTILNEYGKNNYSCSVLDLRRKNISQSFTNKYIM